MWDDPVGEFAEGVTADNRVGDSWRFAIRLLVVAVCIYGGWRALQPDLTMAERAIRFGIPVLLVAFAFLVPMPKKRA